MIKGVQKGLHGLDCLRLVHFFGTSPGVGIENVKKENELGFTIRSQRFSTVWYFAHPYR
jgi:hypothetical protein